MLIARAKNDDILQWFGESYVIKIRDLTFQILDPCSFISNKAGSLYLFSNDVDSIIKQNIIILYQDVIVTNQISHLITDANHEQLFYYLMKQIITIIKRFREIINIELESTLSLNNNQSIVEYSIDIYNDTMIASTLQASLFLRHMTKLSPALPTEYFTFTNNYTFEIFAARISNVTIIRELNSIPGSNVTVTLSNEDTSIGRGEFRDTTSVLDSVDVIVISLNDNPTNSTEINGVEVDFGHTGYAGTPFIASNKVIVNVLSDQNISDSELYDLNGNISIIFTGIQPQTTAAVSDTYTCAWLEVETQIWRNQGCLTVQNGNGNDSDGEIICNCNHLTSFSVVSTLEEDLTISPEQEVTDELGLLNYNVYIFTTLIFLFACVLCYIIYKFRVLQKLQILKEEYKERQEGLKTIAITAICSLCQLIACCMLLIYYNIKPIAQSDIFIEFLTVSLIIPNLLAFLMYTQALKGWISVGNSLNNTTYWTKERVQFAIIIANVTVSTVFLGVAILLISDIDSKQDLTTQFYASIKIFWMAIMFIACIFFIIFGIKMNKVLQKSLHLNVRKYSGLEYDDEHTKKQRKTIERLTIISVVLSIFLLIQALIAAYEIITQLELFLTYDISVMFADFGLQFGYVIIFLWLYMPQVNSIIERKLQLQTNKIKKSQKPKKVRNMPRLKSTMMTPQMVATNSTNIDIINEEESNVNTMTTASGTKAKRISFKIKNAIVATPKKRFSGHGNKNSNMVTITSTTDVGNGKTGTDNNRPKFTTMSSVTPDMSQTDADSGNTNMNRNISIREYSDAKILSYNHKNTNPSIHLMMKYRGDSERNSSIGDMVGMDRIIRVSTDRETENENGNENYDFSRTADSDKNINAMHMPSDLRQIQLFSGSQSTITTATNVTNGTKSSRSYNVNNKGRKTLKQESNSTLSVNMYPSASNIKWQGQNYKQQQMPSVSPSPSVTDDEGDDDDEKEYRVEDIVSYTINEEENPVDENNVDNHSVFGVETRTKNESTHVNQKRAAAFSMSEQL